jgi:HlyD family secretion protein
MRAIWLRRTIQVLLLALGVAVAAWFAWPRPVPVDLAAVRRGPMAVTVEDEAKTRVRHVYTVSAPVAGKVLRISRPGHDHARSRHVGDQVTAGETIVAVMQPAAPGFLDMRSREQLQAALAAADAAVRLAEAEIRRVEAALTFSQEDLRRAQSLARTDAIAARTLDKARLEVDTSEAALASAKAQLEVRRSERVSAAARLIEPTNTAEAAGGDCCIEIRSPVSGRVLKIVQESEAVVAAGAPLIEIGDPADLEVVADLLSTDAVQVQVGAPVRVDGWGGAPIAARVARIDPAGFTKISALGIEEQRVRTTIDFSDPAETWSRLGHDYRVIVHVSVWTGDNVLTVPVGALFRRGDDWAVFALRDGRAQTVPLRIGHRSARAAEILSGLSDGDEVILHPSDRIRDGVSLARRPDG